MKRGEIWTLRDRQYASKARPVIVIQNDAYDNFDSVILCLFTTYDSSEIEVRVPVIPTPENGLHDLSYVMTDKIRKKCSIPYGRQCESRMVRELLTLTAAVDILGWAVSLPA